MSGLPQVASDAVALGFPHRRVQLDQSLPTAHVVAVLHRIDRTTPLSSGCATLNLPVGSTVPSAVAMMSIRPTTDQTTAAVKKVWRRIG